MGAEVTPPAAFLLAMPVGSRVLGAGGSGPRPQSPSPVQPLTRAARRLFFAPLTRPAEPLSSTNPSRSLHIISSKKSKSRKTRPWRTILRTSVSSPSGRVDWVKSTAKVDFNRKSSRWRGIKIKIKYEVVRLSGRLGAGGAADGPVISGNNRQGGVGCRKSEGSSRRLGVSTCGHRLGWYCRSFGVVVI